MSHQDRSGTDSVWVASLGEITPELCKSYLDKIGQTPVKPCDISTCDNSVMYRISYHGCVGQSVCSMHRTIHVNSVKSCIKEQGFVKCPVCDKKYYNADSMITWFLI